MTPELLSDILRQLAGAVIHCQQVARFGERFGAQGALAGSKDANRCIGYLTKYLTKQVADCHLAQTDAQQAHAGRSNRKRVRLGQLWSYEPPVKSS